MRSSQLLFLFVSATVASVTGCASMYHLDEYTTEGEKSGMTPGPRDDGGAATDTSAPGTSDATGPACNTNVECNRFTVGGGDGDIASGATPAVCVKATGRCAPLTTLDCPRLSGDYLDDGAVVVGTLLGGGDATLEQAAFLAAEELDASNGGGGLPALKAGRARPLVVVGCNTSTGVARAARHLVDDLHARSSSLRR